MASLLTTGEKYSFGQTYNDLFDTLSRDIVVFKEPIKTIDSIESTPFFGYPSDTLEESVSYTAVSGVYKARVFYDAPNQDMTSQDTEIKNPLTEVKIRVQNDARNFIESGKTEKITFDNKSWNINYGYVVRRYVNESYYEYLLKEIS